MSVVTLEALIERDDLVLNNFDEHELLELHRTTRSDKIRKAAGNHLYVYWAEEIDHLMHGLTEPAVGEPHAELVKDMLMLAHAAANGMDHSRELWPNVRDQIDRMVAEGRAL